MFQLRKGIKAGLIGGTLAGIIAFLLCCWMASLPAVSPVSSSLAFRPWWRWSNWAVSILFLAVSALSIGIIAALRPETQPETQPHRAPEHDSPVDKPVSPKQNARGLGGRTIGNKR